MTVWLWTALIVSDVLIAGALWRLWRHVQGRPLSVSQALGAFLAGDGPPTVPVHHTAPVLGAPEAELLVSIHLVPRPEPRFRRSREC